MAFEKLTNFRDLGGIKTKDGRRIQTKRLLRSGQPTALTDNDVKLLQDEYMLRAIIDMRTIQEITADPDVKIPGSIYYHLDFFQTTDDEAPSLDNIASKMADMDADAYLSQVYRDIVTTKAAQESLRSFFDIVLDQKEGSVLWHCFAGKDRTGVSAALLLYALGVSREDILTDYLATNESRKAENTIILQSMKEQNLPEAALKNIEKMLYVDKQYLHAAYDEILQKFENVDAFLTQHLGLTQEEIQRLQTLYLA